VPPTSDYGFEVRGDVFDESTGYCVQGAPRGLNSSSHKTTDASLPPGYDGDVTGAESLEANTLSIAVTIPPSDELGCTYRDRIRYAETKAGPLRSAFRPAGRTSALLTLDMLVPGAPTTDELYRFYGRTRGSVESVFLQSGFKSLLCEFRCLDPLAYGDETVETVSTGGSPDTLVFNNPGMSESPRYQIDIVGNGNVPIIEHVESEGYLIIAGGVNISAILIGNSRTVIVDTVENYFTLEPGPRWPVLVPGTNTFNVEGLDDFTVTYRPAYV
jgi:hypothetical protein